MIARLYMILPYPITIPENETFNIYEYSENGYKIRIWHPIKTDQKIKIDTMDELLINGKQSFQANGIRIDFQKESFDRRKNIDCDPPYLLINRTVNLFLSKLRFVTRSSKIRPINFPQTTWKLQYLNDDESELEKDENMVRGRFCQSFSFSWTALNKEIWDEIFKLPLDYNIPKWEELLLDANNALPEIGPCIVLVLTALEVFISTILNELPKNTSINENLWQWINNRDWWMQNPSIDEQFDVLLKQFTGTSLKEQIELWEAFKNLKKARNSFVHEGIAKIDNEIISQQDAIRLLGKATEIIKFVKNKLPDALKWPEYNFSIKVEGTSKLLKNDS